MAADDDLINRVRALLAEDGGVDERRMFGGVAFLLNGNMAVAASGRGGLMVRVPPEQTDRFADRAHAAPMTMSGRPVRGWVRIPEDGVRTTRQLTRWVRVGTDYARQLPPK